MTILLRTLSGVALALILAVTSLQVAAAHGQPRAAGQIEICQGLTITTIAIDADGNPVEATGFCPDYALSLFAATLDAEPALHPEPVWIALSAVPFGAVPLGSRPVPATARGPPDLV